MPAGIAGIVAAVVAATLTWAALDHFAAADSPEPQPLASSAPLFVSEEFGFSAKFPANPERADQVVDAGGQEIAVSTFTAGKLETGYSVSTMAAMCTPVGKDIDTRLQASADGSVKGAAESSGATPKVSGQKPITVAGHPGLQTDFTLTKGSQTLHVMAAIVINGPRFYTLAANNPDEASWANFLASFTTKDAAPAPECAPLAGA